MSITIWQINGKRTSHMQKRPRLGPGMALLCKNPFSREPRLGMVVTVQGKSQAKTQEPVQK
jgi:hypothetical protein